MGDIVSEICCILFPENHRPDPNCAAKTKTRNLDLGLLEAVLPDNDVRGGAVLAVVEEDNHAVGVHGLAGVELPVLELGEDDVLGEGTGLGLEVLDLLVRLALLLEGVLDGLHVACCWSFVLVYAMYEHDKRE